MPFLEVNDFSGDGECSRARRREAARLMTDALASAYDIAPEIISTYFQAFPGEGYAHAGVCPAPEAKRRIFIKIHALRRDVARRSRAADLVTRAAVAAYGAAPKSVVVYFLERSPDEVAHAGVVLADAQSII